MAIASALFAGLVATAAIPSPAAEEGAAAAIAGGKARPARPLMSLPRLFSNKDYPSAARRAREQGTVTFQVDVGVDGRITGCGIVSSSGSALLDAATCGLVKARGRFEPARDAGGRPTPDKVSGRVHWRL